MNIEAMKAPSVLIEALGVAADLLNRTFRTIGSLQGDGDTAIPERTMIVHVAAALLSRGFAVYAEPRLPRSDENPKVRRIDLLASNRSLTVAFEAKTFGIRNLRELHDDQHRLEQYSPQPARLADNSDPCAFWNDSDRWGVIMVQSFAGRGFSQIWEAQTRNQDEFDALLLKYNDKSLVPMQTAKDDWRAFAEKLRAKRADAGAIPICGEGLWKGADQLDLLWAAFPLEKITT